MTTLSIDESSGLQNNGTGESENNELNATLPAAFKAVLDVVAAGLTPQIALSGYTTSNTSGSEVLTYDPANVTDVAFTDSAGLALDGDYSGLRTTDGTSVFLYTSSANNNVLLGRKGNNGGTAGDPTDDTPNANGAVVFAVYLEETSLGAKAWLVQYASLLHPDATDPDDTVSPDQIIFVTLSELTEFSLTGAPSGQNLFLMYADGTPAVGDVGIIVTAENPNAGETVNSSQGGGGTTLGNSNQMTNPGRGLVFSFVDLNAASLPFTVPNLTQGDADNAANIQFGTYHEAHGAKFTVVQLQPNSSGATLHITAIDETDGTEKGASYIPGLNDGDESNVTIDFLKVTTHTTKGKNVTTSVFNFDIADGTSQTKGGITVAFLGDGSVRVTNVKPDTDFEYHSPTLHERVLIHNDGNSDAKLNAAFDIGDFAVNVAPETQLLFDVLQFDDDGPSANGTAVSSSVDEDGLTGGNAGGTGDLVVPNGDGDNNEATTAGNVSGIFAGGADGLASYDIADDPGAALGTSLKSKGGTVVYAVTEGATDTLQAFVNVGGGAGYDAGTDRAVYLFTLNTSTGAYTFTLQDQLDHATLNGLTGDDTENDLTLQLGAILRAIDGDGDAVTAAANKLEILVDDDTPLPLDPGDLKIFNQAGQSASAALGSFGKVGADEPGTAAFVGTNGSALQGSVNGGAQTNLTVGGANILLFGFGTSTLTATTDATNTDATKVVFTMTLNPNGSDVTLDKYNLSLAQTIANLVDINFGNFTTKVSSGNPLTILVENVGGSTVDALFSGFVDRSNNTTTQTTVNVSQAGVGVGTGQDFDFDPQTASTTDDLTDRIRIQFLLDDGDGVLEAGEAFTVNRFTWVANQNNSPNDDGDALLRVYDASGAEVQITGININGQTLVGSGGAPVPSHDGGNVTAVASGLGYELHGLGGGTAGSSADNDTITIITTSGYQRIDISGIGNDASKDTFDILLQSVAIPTAFDITFSVQANLTDFDGDTAATAASLDVTLDADGVFA